MNNNTIFFKDLGKEIELIQNLSIINDFFLILGGGKFGKIALDYAKKKGLPYILIIDKDPNVITENEVIKVNNFKQLETIIVKIRNKQKFGEKKENLQKIFFFKAELNILPLIFSFGMPEFIVPVIPLHIMAYLLLFFSNLPLTRYFTSKDIMEKRFKGFALNLQLNQIIKINTKTQFSKKVLNYLPKDVILNANLENGMISLSYAHFDEICPPNCIGPKDFCPYFKRAKPFTITSIVQNLNKQGITGHVIESHQIQAGLGTLYGSEVKSMLIENLDFIKMVLIEEKYKGKKTKIKHDFFISTTCNCHGIINLFSF
ncbi:MAG: hypothetical protein ACTSWY_05005 [Promethearchaeota archaeon]